MSIKALEILEQLKTLTLVETVELVRQVEDTLYYQAWRKYPGTAICTVCVRGSLVNILLVHVINLTFSLCPDPRLLKEVGDLVLTKKSGI
jgi:hypothetical protein